jgi:hypothetical protein
MAIMLDVLHINVFMDPCRKTIYQYKTSAKITSDRNVYMLPGSIYMLTRYLRRELFSFLIFRTICTTDAKIYRAVRSRAALSVIQSNLANTWDIGSNEL